MLLGARIGGRGGAPRLSCCRCAGPPWPLFKLSLGCSSLRLRVAAPRAGGWLTAQSGWLSSAAPGKSAVNGRGWAASAVQQPCSGDAALWTGGEV